MKLISTILILALVLFVGLPDAQAAVKKRPDHSCRRLKAACRAAHFAIGRHKNKKDLFIDCLYPILKGQTPAGVTVYRDDVKACQVKRAAEQSHSSTSH